MSGRLVLVRHGQSLGNVDKRLDTRPPGAELTPLGREQARAFARAAASQPGLLLHSVATRAVQTAAEISAVVDVPAREVTGIHEVQVGDLEGRNDEDAVAAFNAVYERWLKGERDVSMPGGENANQVLDRYLPVLTELRTRYLDDGRLDQRHRRRQPRCGDPAVRSPIGRRGKQFRARPSSGQH